MPRLPLVSRPGDYPAPDAATQAELAELFGALFPDNPDPAFDEAHAGMAIAAHDPRLALQLARLSGHLAGQTGWSQRTDLRELALLAVNRHFGCDYAISSRAAQLTAAGITARQIAALSEAAASPLFSETQKLVIAYAQAVVTGAVPAPLFAQVEAAFGARGAIDCTAVIGLWSFWAMLLQATAPEL